MAKNVLTYNLSEPVGTAKAARINIDNGDGNMTIDGLTNGEPVLASGTLEYLEKQGLPTRTLDATNGQAALTLKAGKGQQTWLRLPWQTCNGATTWNVHLNPGVKADITAHSGGGNVKIDLTGMKVTRLAADTGGGNMNVVLPENAADLNVTVKSGGGNVTVEIGSGITGSNSILAGSGAGNVTMSIPGGIAARIQATTGMGKVVVDGRFNKIDNKTYQSPDYDTAASKAEITLSSGAGNVTVNTK